MITTLELLYQQQLMMMMMTEGRCMMLRLWFVVGGTEENEGRKAWLGL